MGFTTQPNSIIPATLRQSAAACELHRADCEALGYRRVNTGEFAFHELSIKARVVSRYGDGSLQRLYEESRNFAEVRGVKYVRSGQTVDAARPDVPRRIYDRDELANYSTVAFDDNRSHLQDAIMPQRKKAGSLDVDDRNRTGELRGRHGVAASEERVSKACDVAPVLSSLSWPQLGGLYSGSRDTCVAASISTSANRAAMPKIHHANGDLPGFIH
jgi:hypothetical protein